MSKTRTKPSSHRPPDFIAPPIDASQIERLADRVQQGDAVQTANIDEFVALMRELQQRGYHLRRRSESEKERAPFSFEVIKSENCGRI